MSIALILAVILAVLTLLTLAPRASAAKECRLGYRALCTFTPISTGIMVVPTLILFVVAIVT